MKQIIIFIALLQVVSLNAMGLLKNIARNAQLPIVKVVNAARIQRFSSMPKSVALPEKAKFTAYKKSLVAIAALGTAGAIYEKYSRTLSADEQVEFDNIINEVKKSQAIKHDIRSIDFQTWAARKMFAIESYELIHLYEPANSDSLKTIATIIIHAEQYDQAEMKNIKNKAYKLAKILLKNRKEIKNKEADSDAWSKMHKTVSQVQEEIDKK